MKIDILVVDDDDAHRGMLKTMLGSWGYTVDEATDGDEAVDRVREKAFDAVLTDVRMARMDGIHALKGILEYNPALPVVLMTAYSSVETAVEALRLGAYDYLVKPLDFEALKHTLEKAIEHSRLSVENRELRRQLTDAATRPGILGRSQAVKDMLHIISTVAPTEATVLITGESGTGKELVARALHEGSARADKPLVTVNCAALAENLLESELFGYEKGAFTGALNQGKAGLFELANHGTILLDEIGDLPYELQTKLLRVLQQKEIMRLGGTKPISLDVRVIAATNADLKQKIKEGRFREDLYYRLSVVPIYIPPLRERRGDIEKLVKHYFFEYCTKHAHTITVPDETLDIFRRYSWPGNVRELQNVIEYMVICCEGNVLQPQVLAAYLGLDSRHPADKPASLKVALDDYEKELITRAIEEQGGVRKAAKALGVDASTISRKAKKYGISVAE